MKKIIDGLSRKKLEDLYSELLASGKDAELTEYVGSRLARINEINRDFRNYSSSRIIEHSLADEKRCLDMFKEFYVSQFPFLADSTHSRVNRIGVFMIDRTIVSPYNMTLAELDEFFHDDLNVYNYEGAYNTLNFIKNRFYAVGSDSVFLDYAAKKAICRLRLGDIAKYILDIKSGTKLKLSIGEVGLVRTMNSGYKSNRPYQNTMVEAFAFGTDLNKLKDENYEDCKRLLYLPRNVKNK